jgi:hypothetical protein
MYPAAMRKTKKIRDNTVKSWTSHVASEQLIRITEDKQLVELQQVGGILSVWTSI